MKRAIVGISGALDGDRYVRLAAIHENGKVLFDIYSPKGLTHKACADALLTIPRSNLCFGYEINIDATKIFEGMGEPIDKFLLFHPEARRLRICWACGNRWRSKRIFCSKCNSTRIKTVTPHYRFENRGYAADDSRFIVAEGHGKKRWKKSTCVWDGYNIIRKPLEGALEAFRIGSREDRGAFYITTDRSAAVCDYRAHLIAETMRKAVDGLDDLGIDLKGRYRGAGSIAAALLRKHKVEKRRGPPHRNLDPNLQDAVMRAFFAGRTENAVTGHIKGPLWEYDIASAYAHALYQLPCLACGRWRRVTLGRYELDTAQAALVRFRVGKASGLDWAPLPCRTEDGPVWGTNFSGWGWWPEVKAAMNGWGGLIEKHVADAPAWAYHTKCTHRPFAWIADVYRQRRELEGSNQGLADILKQGLAAVWGKTAQTVGDAPFASYIWAGLATSIIHTRLLEALWYQGSIIAIATDAIIAERRLHFKKPYETGTSDLEKPLGAWIPGGRVAPMFFAAPGLYGAPTADAAIAEIAKARKSVVRIKETRFQGARDAIVAMIRCTRCGLQWDLKYGFDCPKCHVTGGVPKAAYVLGADGRALYGRSVPETREISLAPGPKRDKGFNGVLQVRDLEGVESLPYTPK